MSSVQTTASVAYLRRSSDNKSQEASIGDQRAAIERFAAEKGYRILRWYTDDGISGDATEKRAAFLQMHEDAQTLKDFRAILCWDKARFGRFDSLEYGYYVHPLRKVGVCLVTVTEGITDWNALEGRIVSGVLQEGKHQFLVDHSANTTRGQMESALKGSWIGTAPYAYVVTGPRKNKRLVLGDPVKVAVVRRIFAEFMAGHSMNSIARRLCADGYPSPQGRVNGWRSESVRTILENPAYTGDLVCCKYSEGKYHSVGKDRLAKGQGKGKRKESDWIVHKDKHEPLIDRQTWEAIQCQLAKGKGRPKVAPEDNRYVLSCLLKCGQCGATMHGIPRTGFNYYECASHKYANRRHGEPVPCQGCTVREDAVLRSLADHLEREFGDEYEALAHAAASGNLRAGDVPSSFARVKAIVNPPRAITTNRKSLQKQLDATRAKLGKAHGNLALVDPEFVPTVQESIRGLQGEVNRLEAELRECREPSEQDVNQQTLGLLTSLYNLAACCRILARPVDPKWETVGSLESAAPQAVRKLLRGISSIRIHTEKTGSGAQTRHKFIGGEITFVVAPITGGLQPLRKWTYAVPFAA